MPAIQEGREFAVPCPPHHFVRRETLHKYCSRLFLRGRQSQPPATRNQASIPLRILRVRQAAHWAHSACHESVKTKTVMVALTPIPRLELFN